MPESDADLQAELSRIEAALEAGATDLSALGFWRLVGRVKRNLGLIERYADEIGRIDRAAFERAVHPLFPVWLGNLVLFAGVLLGALLVVVAMRASNRGLAGLALLVAAGIWSGAVHCPAHWLVGRAVGIRFGAYFVGWKPFPPRPGIKIDYASYLRTPARERAWMHASGALASKAAPFVALAFYPVSNAPRWSAATILALGLFQIVTDILFSTKSSDWKKVKRELAVARSGRS